VAREASRAANYALPIREARSRCGGRPDGRSEREDVLPGVRRDLRSGGRRGDRRRRDRARRPGARRRRPPGHSWLQLHQGPGARADAPQRRRTGAPADPAGRPVRGSELGRLPRRHRHPPRAGDRPARTGRRRHLLRHRLRHGRRRVHGRRAPPAEDRDEAAVHAAHDRRRRQAPRRRAGGRLRGPEPPRRPRGREAAGVRRHQPGRLPRAHHRHTGAGPVPAPPVRAGRGVGRRSPTQRDRAARDGPPRRPGRHGLRRVRARRSGAAPWWHGRGVRRRVGRGHRPPSRGRRTLHRRADVGDHRPARRRARCVRRRGATGGSGGDRDRHRRVDVPRRQRHPVAHLGGDDPHRLR